MRSTSRTGFTLIEILVATAILAILSTMVVIQFSSTRKNSRDARRRADTKEYISALERYRLVNGSAFVKDASGGGVGAAGLSYGRLNFKGGTGVKDGGIEYPNASRSIADALAEGGFISSAVTDPQAKTGNPTNSPDYVLIRCASNGALTIGTSDEIFAVWAKMENTPSTVDTENTAHYCGGSLSGITSRANFGSTQFVGPTPSASSTRTTDPVTATTAEIVSKYYASGSGRPDKSLLVNNNPGNTTFTPPPTAPTGSAFQLASLKMTSASPSPFGRPATFVAVPYDPATNPNYGTPIDYKFYCDINDPTALIVPVNGAPSTANSTINACSYSKTAAGTTPMFITVKVVAVQAGVISSKTITIPVQPFPIAVIGGMP